MNTMPAIIIFICTLANAVAMYYSGKSSGYREGYEAGYRYGRLMGFAQATLNQIEQQILRERIGDGDE